MLGFDADHSVLGFVCVLGFDVDHCVLGYEAACSSNFN